MFARKLLILAVLFCLCLPLHAATQDYVFDVRQGGVLTPFLTPTITSAYNASTNAAVTTGLPAVVGLGGGLYVIHYDPATAPLAVIVDAGSTIGDPNERYITLHLTADPSLISATATAVSALPSASAIATAVKAGSAPSWVPANFGLLYIDGQGRVKSLLPSGGR